MQNNYAKHCKIGLIYILTHITIFNILTEIKINKILLNSKDCSFDINMSKLFSITHRA